MTGPRRRRGRPSKIWRGEVGRKFVEAVALARYYSPRPITNSQAIRIVLRRPEFAPLKKYANGSTRYLEKQLIDAAEDWGVSATFRELIGKGSPIWNRKSTSARQEDLQNVSFLLMLVLTWELEQQLLEQKIMCSNKYLEAFP
jgi:hypothetical protein